MRANVIGLGLIGGSIAAGLRARGWHVNGDDLSSSRVDDALGRGCIDTGGIDADADITFVAVPVLAALGGRRAGPQGDVRSRDRRRQRQRSPVLGHRDTRFVGGHPMAGSELEGLDGADADMFSGAVWVLTPTTETSHTTIAAVASAVTALGAEIVAMAPERHDEMVAVVSHVPHLTAASLMGLAADGADEHAALLRLAAGGFRDMTRIASGHPDIWLDICDQNREAIVDGLDRLIDRLGEMRDLVGAVDRDGLLERLQRARLARTNLPSRIVRPETLAEVRIPIPDRPGAAAEIFTLAAREGINIASFEVVHLAESNVGVAVVLVDADAAEAYRAALAGQGLHPAVSPLT